KHASVRVRGNAGTGLAENIMSGTVVVEGNASQSAGATGRGGLLVVHGDAAARCGISMKGVEIVVRGSIGHMSAFMAQRGCLVVRDVIAEIQRAAREGIYDIRGFGAKRRVPHFDDLLLLGASISRYPLEGYRERCGTDVVLGTRFASKPLRLKIPVTIAGMSFGALSAPAKEALGRAATEVGTSTTTGDGGMTAEERRSSETLVYQLLP